MQATKRLIFKTRTRGWGGGGGGGEGGGEVDKFSSSRLFHMEAPPARVSKCLTESDGGMEGWRDGGMEGWRDGGMEGWRDGGMEGWRDGGMEGWRDGGMEGWRDGGMEGWSESLHTYNLENINFQVKKGLEAPPIIVEWQFAKPTRPKCQPLLVTIRFQVLQDTTTSSLAEMVCVPGKGHVGEGMKI